MTLRYKCEQELEILYVKWLEASCACNLLPLWDDDYEPCTCMDFDEWFEYKQKEAAESQVI